MYTKEEREGILWEFHRSGMGVREACRRLPLFPCVHNLYRWLRMEEAGELAATEMPDRAARMHCAHGEGSPRYAARRPRREREGAAMAEGPEQTDWRDWGADLPEDPTERARMAEVKLAEALAVLDVLKAPGPAPLTSMEKWRAGELARERSPLVRLRDVTETLSIPKSTYLDQAARASRPDPKAALRERVRASFEASGGAYGAESVTADLRSGEGEPVSWRDLAPGDAETPVVASEKVVRAIMAEEGLVSRKAAQAGRRARYSSYAGELSARPANVPLAGDGAHDFHAPEPGLLVVTDVTEFRLDGFRAYLSPAIDCFDGWPVCWSVSRHPDKCVPSSKTEPPPSHRSGALRRRFRAAPHERVAHPVGLPVELQEPAVVAYPVDHRGCHLVVPEHGRPAAELQVRRDHQRPSLVAVGHHLEQEPRPSASRGRYPSSSTTTILARATCASSRSSLPSAFARRSLATSDDAVKNLASTPSEHASWTSALAMCVFPVPTSPMSTRSSRRSRKDRDSRSGRPKPSGNETGAQSYPSNVLDTGSAAARRSLALRDASREDTSASR